MASRGWKPTDVIVVFGWVYLGGLFHHGKTRKNDVLTVASFAGAGRGNARLVARRSTLGRARLLPSRGWKPTDVIVVFGWVYFTTERHGTHGKTTC